MSSNSSDCSQSVLPTVAVPAKRANLYNDAPLVVKHLVQLQRADGTNYTAFRSSYTATLTLTAAQIAAGVPQELTIGALPDSALRPDLNGVADATYCIMSACAERVESTFDFALSWRLDTAARKRATARSPFDPGADVVRPLVVDARQSKLNGKDKSVPLLIRPLFYVDRVESVAFSAIDAWGFDSTALIQHVARQLAGERYYIPTSYPYAYLIARVHCCIKLANARAHPNALYAETMAGGAYALPNSRDGYIISKADLDAVIEYIDTRLLSSLVKFNPNSLSLVCAPFEPVSWLEMYQKHAQEKQSQGALRMAAPASEPLSCTVNIVVWFVRLDAPIAVRSDGSVSSSAAVDLLHAVNSAPAPANEHAPE